VSLLLGIALIIGLVLLLALASVLWNRLHPPPEPEDPEQPTPIIDIVP
jgi:hypothetical protein